MNPVRHALALSLLFTAIGAHALAAPDRISLEAESLPGAPRRTVEGASPGGNPAAVPFDASLYTLDYRSPRALPQGAVWIMVRMKPDFTAESTPSQVLIKAGNLDSMELIISHKEFAWYRIPATSNGSPNAVQLTFRSGAPLLIDRIDFVQGADAAMLPAPAQAERPQRVVMLHDAQEPSINAANALYGRLQQGNIEVSAPVSAAGSPALNQTDLLILFCGDWNDEAALRWLPAWAAQPFSGESSWVVKPSGVFGGPAVLGINSYSRSGIADAALQSLLRGTPTPAAPPETMQEAGGLSDPRKATAMAALHDTLAWLDSPDTLGTPPAALIDDLEAALGNWLYRAPSWQLSDAQRVLAGTLLVKLAGLAHQDLAREAEISPQTLQRATGLWLAAQAFGSQPSAEQWRQAAQSILSTAQSGMPIETLRGRIAAHHALAQYQALAGGADDFITALRGSLQSLMLASTLPCTFGDEPIFATLEEMARWPAFMRSAQPGGFGLRILPRLTTAAGEESFDKAILRGPAVSAAIDGVSGGAGGYDDAGALLHLVINNLTWVAGPGPDQPSSLRQNGLTITIDGRQNNFAKMTRVSRGVSGRNGAIFLRREVRENGEAWARYAMLVQTPPALILLDSVTPSEQAFAQIVSNLNLIGEAAQEDGRVILRHNGIEMAATALSTASAALLKPEGERTPWQQRWEGQPEPGVLLRTVIAPPELTPERLEAPGVRLAPGIAAFCDQINFGNLRIDAASSLLTPGEAVILSAMRLRLGMNDVLQARQPYPDLVVRPDAIEVHAIEPTVLTIALPEDVAITNAGGTNSGRIEIAPGTTVLALSRPDALAALFEAMTNAIDQIPTGDWGTPSTGLTPEALPDRFAVLRSASFDEPLAAWAQSAGELLIGAGHQLLAAGERATRAIATLDSPITALAAIDLDLNGVNEIAVGTADGRLHLLQSSGMDLGALSLGESPIEEIWTADVDGDGMEVMAAWLPADGLVAMVDALGRVRARAAVPSNAHLVIGDADGDGVDDAVAYGPGPERCILLLRATAIQTAALPDAEMEITSAAIGNGTVFFGRATGVVEAWRSGGDGFENDWSTPAADQAINGVESFEAGGAALVAGTAGGAIVALDAAGNALWSADASASIERLHAAPRADGGLDLLALTAAPSALLLSPQGQIRALWNFEAPRTMSVLWGERPALVAGGGATAEWLVWSASR